MKGNPVLFKSLVVGVIVLFVGVGIQPAFADISDSDDCNICPKINNSQVVKLRSLLDGVENYANLLSLLSKHNPKVVEINPEISNKITTIKEMSNKLNSITDWESTPFLCLFLIMAFIIPLVFGPFYDFIIVPILIVFPWLILIALPLGNLLYNMGIFLIDLIDKYECLPEPHLLIIKLNKSYFGLMEND